MNFKKRCGNCKNFFLAWKGEGLGLCSLYDYKCQTDAGKNCKGWKGIKYDRLQYKKENRMEIENKY